MPDVESAVELATEMVQLGEGAGRRTVALITAMDNPLGRSVGNALEVQEALDALAGRGDEELVQVSLVVAREMCWLAEVERDPDEALRSGDGLKTFQRMLSAQGGRLEAGLPVAPVQLAVESPGDGYIESIDALEVGLAGLDLGVGRRQKEDKVDPAAGIVIEAQVGALVRAGETLAIIHARSEDIARSVMPRLQKAWRLSQHEVQRPPHVLARVDKDGVTKAL
jgi:thymidine phosphorylase